MSTDVASEKSIEFAKALVQRAIGLGADDAEVSHVNGEYFEIESDAERVNLARTNFRDGTALTVFSEGRKGSASFTGQDPQAIDGALDLALKAAKTGAADDANVVAPGSQSSLLESGPDDADRGPMLEAVHAHLAWLKATYPQVLTRSATYAFNDARRYFANSAGVCQAERRGAYRFGTMVIAKEGERSTSFNYSGAESYAPFASLAEAGSVRAVIAGLVDSLDPKPVPEKFVGDVIITPDCLGSMLGPFVQALSGYALFAGTTPFKDHVGEVIASEKIKLENKPLADDFPSGAAFDDRGVPTQNLVVIEDGVLQDFLVDFYCAKKLRMQQTAGMQNLSLACGDKSLQQLVAETQRGILFSRFSGGNPNNNLDFSGIAKNSFYIEDGVIRHALIETMVSGNLQELFKNVRDISTESVNFGGSRFPYVAASSVTISGK